MYILLISPKAFIAFRGNEMIITSNVNKASTYETIGEAMRKAAEANAALETHCIRVMSL